MQKVSNAYKASMKTPLRNRGYIMITFGVLNQEAQAQARIDKADLNYYSNTESVFKDHDDSVVYATLEQDFTKTDGSMYFPPRQSPIARYYDTGIISKNLVSDGAFTLTINLHILPTDFKGISINFGENYPIDFDVVGSTGQTIEFRGNDRAQWDTEEVLNNTDTVTFVFYKMKSEKTRLRIYSIRFGYGLVYYNDSVMESTLDSYLSPIGEDVPQIDFSVKLKNYDKYFNVDNPKSAINFLETGQEMEIFYGYELDDKTVEWVKGNHLLCSEWESDDYSATIRCQDVYRNMDSEYYRGMYNTKGVSYYQLAENVMKDAGATKYYIDPRLKRLYSKNPIPRVPHKEALQIIANACRCVLSQTRDGYMEIKSNFLPLLTITSNGEEPYSNVSNVLKDTTKDEYGTMAVNYTSTNGKMYLTSRSLKSTKNTGYVSSYQSDANGEFTKNPILTITQEAACRYYGIKLVFGNALPSQFVVRTYNNNTPVNEYVIEKEYISQITTVRQVFDDFDKMEIEFIKTAEPYNRIVLNYFAMGDITEFLIERKDMKSSPKAIKQELIKEVIVPCYMYQNGTQEDTLIQEEVEVNVGDIETYYIGDASYALRVTLDEQTSGIQIVESGNYFITLKYTVSGKHKLAVFGYKYKVVSKNAVVVLHNRGKTITWENPLISDMTLATELANWLGDYYQSGIEYEYDYRGNPELDTNDIIYQENEFVNDMKVNVYRHTLSFNQAFSGKIVARRQGG